MDKSGLQKNIRTVADFPKAGILFYDITSVLVLPEAFSFCINEGIRWIGQLNINKIAAIDARGFLFAAPIAYQMGLPLIIIRKNRKLPGPTVSKSFVLEYSEEKVEVQRHDISTGDRIVIVDDIIATGGTLKATAELLAECGASAKHFFAIIGLSFLDYRKILQGYQVETIIDYDS